MAQLRYSLRALAVTTTDPAELLGHLNRITCDLDEERPETAATAIVARYEPALRRLTWAQAGHPPPLLSRGGRTRPLPRPAGPLLGVVEDAVYECAELRLAVGDLLLLYTDGLVEYRRRSLDEGLDAVIRTVDEAVAAAPAAAAGRAGQPAAPGQPGRRHLHPGGPPDHRADPGPAPLPAPTLSRRHPPPDHSPPGENGVTGRSTGTPSRTMSTFSL